MSNNNIPRREFLNKSLSLIGITALNKTRFQSVFNTVKKDHDEGMLLYRRLPILKLSELYDVEVRMQDGSYKSINLYQMDNNMRGLVTKFDHWGAFAFEPENGAVDIRISLKNDTELNKNNAELVNKTYKNVSTDFKNGKLIIRISAAKKHLFVRIKGYEDQPLTIFVDPLKESEIPPDAKVVRFKAREKPYVFNGRYDRYSVPNDVDIVYLEDGALIMGTIHTDEGRMKSLKVMGRGVVLGNGTIVHHPKGIPYNAVVLKEGIGNVVEGITVIKSRHFAINVGDFGKIDNVKMFGYQYNNDGVSGGYHSVIENSYFKVNDDNVKLYNDDIIVRNCTFYVQTNGGIFQFGWFEQEGAKNCLIEDCEVVACEYNHCGDPANGDGGIARSFISLHDQSRNDDFEAKNNVFRNILIQGQLQRLIGINGKYEHSNPLSFEDTKVENVKALKKPLKKSWIYTSDSRNISFTFKDVVLGNTCINKEDFKTEGKVQLNFEPC